MQIYIPTLVGLDLVDEPLGVDAAGWSGDSVQAITAAAIVPITMKAEAFGGVAYASGSRGNTAGSVPVLASGHKKERVTCETVLKGVFSCRSLPWLYSLQCVLETGSGTDRNSGFLHCLQMLYFSVRMERAI
jgi:hypothetical protein